MNTMMRIFAPEAEYEVFIGDQQLAADVVVDEIESFASLPKGWDYGRGGPISAHVRAKALEWLSKLQSIGFVEIEAFPGDTEIMLAASADNHYFELIVESDRSITISYDYMRKRVFYRSRMSDYEAWQTIIEIKMHTVTEGLREKQWSASEYFILVDTTKRSASSPDLHSVIPVNMTQDYLLWNGSASEPIRVPFAPTFENTIQRNSPTSLGNLQFFGDSIRIENYRADIR
jgi:hypothetical protein